MSDEVIELQESDSEYRDYESNEVSLVMALSNFECPDCNSTIYWVLDPDPDSLQYYSDKECECGRTYYIEPTRAKVTGYENAR